MYQAKEYLLAEMAEQAYAKLMESPDNGIIGGGLWMRMGHKAYDTLIDLTRLGLDEISVRDGFVRFGAEVSFRQLETEPLLRERFGGALGACVRPVVGVQFRRMATLGGTVFGKLAFSDVIPVLLALDAEVELFGAGRMSLESFLKKPAGRDLLLYLYIPDDGRMAAVQTLRNTATDFGLLNLCTAKLPDGSFRVTVDARPAGSVRCPEAEAALSAGDLAKAFEAVAALSYGSNLRASAEYRREMAPVLLGRCLEQLKEVTE